MFIDCSHPNIALWKSAMSLLRSENRLERLGYKHPAPTEQAAELTNP